MRKLLVAGLLAGLVASPLLPSFAGVATGDDAPAFTLTDTQGKAHSLSDFEGKYVVLEWVSFQCPFVKKHYDSGNMQKLQKEFADKGVVWLSICSSAPGNAGYAEADKINEMLAEKKTAQAAYLVDSDGTVGKAYGAKTTPHMFVVSPDGKVIYQGAIDDNPAPDPEVIPESKNYVVEALTAAMSGQEVAKATTKPYGCGVKYGK